MRGTILSAWRKRSSSWALVAVSLAAVSLFGAVGAMNSEPRSFNAAASGDTYLSSYAPTTPQGTSTTLWVSSGTNVNWTLIAFDISGRLRPGDLVVGARIGLTVSEVIAPIPSAVLRTGRTLTAWQENTTTFDTAPLFAFDVSTSTSAGAAQGLSRGSTVWIDVTKQLSRWHSYGRSSNFGTVIMMGPGSGSGAIGFASRDNAQLTKPVLAVSFLPGPRSVYPYAVEPGAAAIAVARTD